MSKDRKGFSILGPHEALLRKHIEQLEVDVDKFEDYFTYLDRQGVLGNSPVKPDTEAEDAQPKISSH